IPQIERARPLADDVGRRSRAKARGVLRHAPRQDVAIAVRLRRHWHHHRVSNPDVPGSCRGRPDVMERSLPAGAGAAVESAGDERRYARVEALLAKYPAVSDAELAELVEWFEREASAYDVGVIASNESIRSAY